MTSTSGRRTIVPLTNKSGGGVIAGDVVVVDTTNNDAFTTSTAGAVVTTVGVVQETIANNAVGRVALSGYVALVNVNASVTRGNFGKTHTVAKQATDAGASRTTGTFCQFLTGGTTPDAILFGYPDSAAGGAGAPTDAVYIVGAANGTLSAEVVKAYMSDNLDPDKYPTSPATEDDEFEGGGAIDAKWTKTNDPAAGDAWDQTTYAGFARVGLVELGTDNVANYVLLTQTAPTGTATMRFRARLSLQMSGVATDQGEFAHVAVTLIDTANGIAVGSGITVNNVDTGDVYRPVAQLDTAGTPGNMTTSEAGTIRLEPATWYYVELRKTTTAAYTSANTYEAWISKTGIGFHQVGTCSATFTATPVVGISIRRPKSQTGTPAGEAIIDFFRKTA